MVTAPPSSTRYELMISSPRRWIRGATSTGSGGLPASSRALLLGLGLGGLRRLGLRGRGLGGALLLGLLGLRHRHGLRPLLVARRRRGTDARLQRSHEVNELRRLLRRFDLDRLAALDLGFDDLH